MRRTILAVAVLGGLAAATGITMSAAAAAAAAAPPAPKGTFVITIHHGDEPGGPLLNRTTLNCHPPGGTHPRPHIACAALAQGHGDFTQLKPVNRACPDLYRPVTVVVTGTWFGRQSDFLRTYANQCIANADSHDIFNLAPFRR